MPEHPSAWLLATCATVTGVVAVGAGVLVGRHTGVGLAVLTAVLVSVALGIVMDPVLRWASHLLARRERDRRG